MLRQHHGAPVGARRADWVLGHDPDLPLPLLLRLGAPALAPPLVVFGDAHVVDGVRKVGPMIAEKLFRHGVYRLEISDRECLVSLVPCDATFARKRVFVNPGFVPDV